jgi:hypothetical protein
MAGKAAHPNTIPTNPFKIRWTLVGPKGTWINEATKNPEVITATRGNSSTGTFRSVNPVIAAVPAQPAANDPKGNTPSAMCIRAPWRCGGEG